MGDAGDVVVVGQVGQQSLAAGIGLLVLIGATGMLFRTVDPETFARFSREEGLWEPITLMGYVGSAMLLFRAARKATDIDRRHLVLVASVFTFLVLEEIDYFGVFGGMIGRIEGIYVGSLHDLVGLGKAGLVPSMVAVALGATTLVVAWRLLATGYLQPKRLLHDALSIQGAWVVTGGAFLALALVEEAGLFGVHLGPPSPEELFELLGALCLVAFALQARADALSPERDDGEAEAVRHETRLVDPMETVR